MDKPYEKRTFFGNASYCDIERFSKNISEEFDPFGRELHTRKVGRHGTGFCVEFATKFYKFIIFN